MPHALGTHSTAEELLSNDRVFLSLCKLETMTVTKLAAAGYCGFSIKVIVGEQKDKAGTSVSQRLFQEDDRRFIFLLYM